MNIKTRPLVSVIMPAYNSDVFIEESINSVLNQSYSNIELIVLNDGSSDHTQQIMDSFGDRIKAVHTSNHGVAAARNKEIKLAKGEWIAFCDSDDVWFPDKLEKQLTSINNFIWSYTDSFYIGGEYAGTDKRSDLSEMVEGSIFESLLVENILTTSSLLIKKQVLLDNGLFDESLQALEDWKLWLAIAKNHPIQYINTPLLNYRVHSGSTSRRAREMLPLHISFITSFLEDIDQNKRSLIRSLAIERSCISCSYIAEQDRDMTYSFKCAWLAFANGKSYVSFKRVIVTFVKATISGFASGRQREIKKTKNTAF